MLQRFLDNLRLFVVAHSDTIEHMFNTGIDEREIPVCSDDLVAALAELDRLTAYVTAAVGHFDTLKLWNSDDANSMIAWLCDRARYDRSSANRLVRHAKKLSGLPVTTTAWKSGSLSGGQVNTIVANLTDTTTPLLAQAEPELVPTLLPLSTAETETVMRGWKAAAETVVETEPDDDLGQVRLSRSLGGRRYLNGSLSAEDGETVEAALRVGTRADDEDETRTVAQRNHDALVDICRRFLDHQPRTGGSHHRPHVNIVQTVDDLENGGRSHTTSGHLIDGPTTRQWACDAAIHRVIRDGRSAILDYGMSTRTIPTPLWNALVIRDGHCRFPGCDRKVEWCEGHHIKHWAAGGPTNLDNLVLMCTHHHRCHQPGWHVELLPDGEFRVTRPDGLIRFSRPPGTLTT